MSKKSDLTKKLLKLKCDYSNCNNEYAYNNDYIQQEIFKLEEELEEIESAEKKEALEKAKERYDLIIDKLSLEADINKKGTADGYTCELKYRLIEKENGFVLSNVDTSFHFIKTYYSRELSIIIRENLPLKLKALFFDNIKDTKESSICKMYVFEYLKAQINRHLKLLGEKSL